MNKILALFAFLLSFAAFGGTTSPCYWSGSFTKCFTAGVSLGLSSGTNDTENLIQSGATTGYALHVYNTRTDGAGNGLLVETASTSGATNYALSVRNNGVQGFAVREDGQILASDTINMTGASGNWAAVVANAAGAASGTSLGEIITAGTTSADYALRVRDRGTVDHFSVRGDGAVTITGTGGNTPHNCSRALGTASAVGGTSATASCGSQFLLTGGCEVSTNTSAVGLTENYPASTSSWQCSRLTGGAGTLQAAIVCCDE